ncbi:MAG: glycosyltransferase family 1 protein [Verrucomicrobiia bacterium]
MKQIVIDGVCLGRRKTGNETYIRGLLTGLEQIREVWRSDFHFTILTTSAHTAERQTCFEWMEIPLGHFAVRNFVRIPQLLTRLKPDLYHATYWIRWWQPPCPTLLTVHDISFVSFPQGFKAHERLVYASIIRWCAQRAEHVVTISRFSKSELEDRWKLPPSKVTSIYLGVDAKFIRPAASHPAELPAEAPFVLAVGNLHPRKNLRRLIEAFLFLKRDHKIPHLLRIVGQPAWLFDDVFESVRREKAEAQVTFTGYLSDAELVETYQRAAVMVYPSLYEGFGFPPLEAMACGCPVVCSTAGSLPEVAGDAAVMVDPHSIESIAQGILDVISDPVRAAGLRERGFEQAGKFTWKTCAEETLELYRGGTSQSLSS